MPKNVLQDVMPPKKRSIRNIPLSTSNGGKKKNIKKTKNLDNFAGPIEGIKSARKSKKNSLKIRWWLIIGIIIISILIFLPLFFSGAKIILVPKQENSEIDTNLVAVREGTDIEKVGVPYRILVVNSEGLKITSNVTEKEVIKKASGQITVFNNYSSSSQRLTKNTRFETSDGLIYRTPKSVIVPGKTIKNGKIVPGSITITVYADSPGKEYNIDMVDFTIPGLKGTDLFDKFFARSKTSMVGGFSGIMKIVPDNELKQMREEIQVDLAKELKDNIYSQIPENFVLYRDGIYINFKSQDNIDLGDSVQVIEKGILTAILFNKNSLSEYIAKNVVNLGNSKVEISNIDELNFSIKNKNYIKPWEDKSFEFSLEGNANFIWVFDEEKMKEDFLGQPKKNTNALLSDYEGIKEAEVIISPFWKRSFPKDIKKIEIQRTIK